MREKKKKAQRLENLIAEEMSVGSHMRVGVEIL